MVSCCVLPPDVSAQNSSASPKNVCTQEHRNIEAFSSKAEEPQLHLYIYSSVA